MADGVALANNEEARLRARIKALEGGLDAERRRNTALVHSEALHRKLIEMSPDAIYVHDDNRRIVFMNPAGARLFGADSADQLIGALATSLVHPESRGSVDRHIDKVLGRNTSSVQLEQRRLRLDGSDFYADVMVSAITWNEAPAGLVVVRDVSERLTTRERALKAEAESRAARPLGDPVTSRLASSAESRAG